MSRPRIVHCGLLRAQRIGAFECENEERRAGRDWGVGGVDGGRGRAVRGICFKESNVKPCSAVDLCWTKHLHRTEIPTETETATPVKVA